MMLATSGRPNSMLRDLLARHDVVAGRFSISVSAKFWDEIGEVRIGSEIDKVVFSMFGRVEDEEQEVGELAEDTGKGRVEWMCRLTRGDVESSCSSLTNQSMLSMRYQYTKATDSWEVTCLVLLLPR